jgi:hypothetical protein
VPDDDSVDDLFLTEGKRSQRLRKQLYFADLYSRLAGSRPKERSGNADEVTDIEVRQLLKHRIAELIATEVDLDLAYAVSEMAKDRFSVRSPSNDPTAKTHNRSFVGSGRKESERLDRVMCWIKRVREWRHA